MVSFVKWQFLLYVAFLAPAASAWAQREPEPHASLRFAPVTEMKRRGQTASVDIRAEVKLAITQIKSGYIGQPTTFEVEIYNIGTHPTPADASLLVRIRTGFSTEEYGLLYGVVAPKKKRIVHFEYRPLLPSQDVVVAEGIWDSKSTGWTQARAETRLLCEYDPTAPLNDFLPVRPQTANQQPIRLPTKLSEVPEVSFAEPFPNDMEVPVRRLKVASTLAKINHVNRNKTDAYQKFLVSQRSDLTGLPFVFGDDCRKKGTNKAQFAATTERIRNIQRSGDFDSAGSTHNDFANNRQMLEVVKILGKQPPVPAAVQVAALWQMITPESAGNRLELVKYLHGSVPEVDAAQALAKLAIYSEEERIRAAALDALKARPEQEYADILVSGLSYPWPPVAERASSAMAKLGRSDLLPQLQEVLKKPDPRLPQTRLVNGKPKTFVRELVRINHMRNCMLCHAPAAPGNGQAEGTPVARNQQAATTAEVPIPGETIEKYYGESIPDLFVRFDVTYLRQDFSVTLPVENASPWPAMQRYDFVVRSRDVSEQEARLWRDLLPADAASPYHRAARAAIAELSKREPDGKRSNSAR